MVLNSLHLTMDDAKVTPRHVTDGCSTEPNGVGFGLFLAAPGCSVLASCAAALEWPH